MINNSGITGTILKEQGRRSSDRTMDTPVVVSLNHHPCLTCGACCALYRPSFYWAEADDSEGGTVPASMTEKLDHHRVFMKGTSGERPRCCALQGDVGGKVFCSIYDRQPSVCREFPVSWEQGEPNERCDRAREAWGLQPLCPTWSGTPGGSRVAA